MKAMIIRTGSGSFPVRNWTAPSSPRISVSIPVQEPEKKPGCFELSRRSISRASSEPDMIRSGMGRVKSTSNLGSGSLAGRILEEEEESGGSLTLMENRRGFAGDWPQRGIPLEDMGFPSGGVGKNWNSGDGGGGDQFGTGGNADRSKIGAYYEEMIKSNPTNSLLLRNYGKYLHEVEGDLAKAEEYYGRALLASPGDGEVLSLYGKLIWENERDGRRAKSYFDQAVQAAPDDCTVLGSYAHFMWQADEDDDDDEDDDQVASVVVASATTVEAEAALVEAF
ncbi:hypothetical protein ACH5RR_039035 [Cinchona calisaya]|uniref:Uncharacterized protein n=1 Tax=Cinchona calisaya TaxID=153742 RepID=A0ABD2Y0F2_9GENT